MDNNNFEGDAEEEGEAGMVDEEDQEVVGEHHLEHQMIAEDVVD